jgi:hypothetical protein
MYHSPKRCPPAPPTSPPSPRSEALADATDLSNARSCLSPATANVIGFGAPGSARTRDPQDLILPLMERTEEGGPLLRTDSCLETLGWPKSLQPAWPSMAASSIVLSHTMQEA